MDNENTNSPESPQAPEKPPRSKIERAIVWTVIAVLLLITGMEALSMKGYDTTLENFEEANDAAEQPMTLAYFKSDLKSGLAIQTTGEREGRSTVLFKWPSLMKNYELHLTVAPDNVITTYATSEGPAGMVNGPRSKGGPDDGEEFEDAGFPGAPGESGRTAAAGEPGETAAGGEERAPPEEE